MDKFQGEEGGEGSVFFIIESPAFIESDINPMKHVGFLIYNCSDSSYVFTELCPSSLETLGGTKSKFKVVVENVPLAKVKEEYMERVKKGKMINCKQSVRLEDVLQYANEKFFNKSCMIKETESGYELFPQKSGYNSKYSLLAWIGTNCQNYGKGLIKYFTGKEITFQYEVGRGIVIGAGLAAVVAGGMYAGYSLYKKFQEKEKKGEDDVDDDDEK